MLLCPDGCLPMTSFPLRAPSRSEFSLSEAAEALDVPWDGSRGDPCLRDIATLRNAGETDLAPVGEIRYVKGLADSSAGALLLGEKVVGRISPDEERPRLVVPDIHGALATLLEWLYPQAAPPEAGIHPTAVVDASARVDSGVWVGPYAVIEEGVELGEGVRVGAHTVIGAFARIGARSLLHPHVVVYPRTEVGRDVILHAGVRLGVDGFGYVFDGRSHRKVPQVGRCIVEDDVEIGANTAIDRGSIGDTWIGAGGRIDNLVHLGHNVELEELVVMAGQVGLAGSTRVGKGSVFGGQAGVAGHLEIGPGARIAARAGIIGDVPAGATFMGFPGRPRSDFLRTTAVLGKVPELLRRVRALEDELERLGATSDSEGAGRPEDV